MKQLHTDLCPPLTHANVLMFLAQQLLGTFQLQGYQASMYEF